MSTANGYKAIVLLFLLQIASIAAVVVWKVVDTAEAMVSNLLVVLCGESQATSIVNAGSLYT